MIQSERNARTRQKWIQVYEQLGSITKTAIRCGISRPTLYRWIERARSDPDSKLLDKSKRPKDLTNNKVTKETEALILDIRKRHNWG